MCDDIKAGVGLTLQLVLSQAESYSETQEAIDLIFQPQKRNSKGKTYTCFSVSINHAYPKLAPYRPAGQLLSPQLLLSVFLNSCFTCIVLVSAFLSVKQQPWYCEAYQYR